MPDWAEVKACFAWDGAWRDIIVPGSDKSDWERFLETVRSGVWPAEYQVNGKAVPLPVSFDSPSASEGRLLRIGVLADGLNCHLWTDGEIKLDFIPTNISGQGDLDLLSAFCRQVASVVGKPVAVTYENMADAIILEFSPHEYAEDGLRR